MWLNTATSILLHNLLLSCKKKQEWNIHPIRFGKERKHYHQNKRRTAEGIRKKNCQHGYKWLYLRCTSSQSRSNNVGYFFFKNGLGMSQVLPTKLAVIFSVNLHDWKQNADYHRRGENHWSTWRIFREFWPEVLFFFFFNLMMCKNQPAWRHDRMVKPLTSIVSKK